MKAKLRAARRLQLARQVKAREQIKLQENFERLVSESSGLLRRGDEKLVIKPRNKKPLAMKGDVLVQVRRDFPVIPSHGPDKFVPTQKPKYKGQLAIREAEAQK